MCSYTALDLKEAQFRACIRHLTPPCPRGRGQRAQCLAIVYDKLGRHADAEAVFAKLKASRDDTFLSAEIYAQWGNISKALESPEATLRECGAGLAWLKVDPLMDPLRKEPRFQSIERALKFPH